MSESTLKSALDRIFVEHIELWLSALGLLFIWVIPELLSPLSQNRWRTTAFTAIAVGIIHGVIFWVVRRRRQRIKAQAQAIVEQENARLEERVQERTEQLRRLAAELGMAEQRERHRLAVLLHDQVQQLLFSVQMQLQSLLPGEAAVPEIGAVNRLLGKAIASTRDLSVDLSPPVLAGEGLDQALQWLALHMDESRGLKVSFENRAADTNVDEAMRVLLFQVVKELLSGAAADRQPVIVLEDRPDRILICIKGLGASSTPPGAGLADSAPAGPDGAVLSRLRERLYFVGGTIDVQSQSQPCNGIAIMAPRATEPPDSRR